MGDMYCNISIKKVKYKKTNRKSLSNLGVHLLRTHKEEYNLADKKRRGDNEVLVKMECETLSKSLDKFLDDRSIKTRNSTTVQAYQIVFSIPKESFGNPKLIDEFKKRTLDFINTNPIFAGNCLSLVYHGDEVQPHIQGVFVPAEGSKLNYKKLLGGPDGPEKLHALHDQFAGAMAPLGLKRGDGTHTNGLSHAQYAKAVTDLQKTPQVKPAPLAAVPEEGWFNKSEVISTLQDNNGKLTGENKQLRKQNKKLSFYETQNREMKNVNSRLKKRVQQLEKNQMRVDNLKLDDLRAIDCNDVMQLLGYESKSEGETTRFRTDEINLVVNSRNQFTENKSGVSGGGAIDLLCKVFKYPFKEAISFLSSHFGADNTTRVVMSMDDKVKGTMVKATVKTVVSEMPTPKPQNISKVVEYLCQNRGIEKQLVDDLISKNLLFADNKNNCVFTNQENTFAFIRGTYEGKRFVGTRGDMDFIKYQYGDTKNLYVFESAIDALSYRTINPKADGTYIVCNGSALINKVCAIADTFDNAILCFDNDEQGKKFCAKIQGQTVTNVSVSSPVGKDFNEDLIKWRQQTQHNPKLKI